MTTKEQRANAELRRCTVLVTHQQWLALLLSAHNKRLSGHSPWTVYDEVQACFERGFTADNPHFKESQ